MAALGSECTIGQGLPDRSHCPQITGREQESRDNRTYSLRSSRLHQKLNRRGPWGVGPRRLDFGMQNRRVDSGGKQRLLGTTVIQDVFPYNSAFESQNFIMSHYSREGSRGKLKCPVMDLGGRGG